MDSFTHRSRFTVKVPRRPDLLREFPFDKTEDAQAYLQWLRTQGWKAWLDQAEDTIEVRIRTKGFAPCHFTAPSYEDAERTANQIAGERARGLLIDYTKSMKVTMADLVRRYVIEECPKHKGCEVDSYALNAMLCDAGAKAVPYAEQRHGTHAKAKPRKPTGRDAHATIRHLERMHSRSGHSSRPTSKSTFATGWNT